MHKTKILAVIGVLIAVIVGVSVMSAQSPTPTPPPPSAPAPDHYNGYNAGSARGTTFRPLSADLADQFGQGTFKVLRTQRLYNPVSKNGEDISDISKHYVGYRLSRTAGSQLAPSGISVFNQFGSIQVNLRDPNLLLAPSAKALGQEQLGNVPGANHFLCYPVEGAAFEGPGLVTLSDQFAAGTSTVVRPVRFCTPVEKTVDGQMYGITPSTLVNGGFETGDLSGWSVSLPPGATASAVPFFPFGPSNFPVEGSYFALLIPGEPYSWATLSQTFPAVTGQTISGFAFFSDAEGGSCSFNDSAEVRIKLGVAVVATPFSASSCATGTLPWTPWSHTFAAPGTYTIEVRIANGTGSPADSAVGLDFVDTDAHDHLMCYRVTPKESPTRREVRVNNQFGVQQLNVKRETELCVPSHKEVNN